MPFERIALIVLDSVGIGEMPDAPNYGDEGTHTLGHILEAVPGIALPELRQLGLANIARLADWTAHDKPTGAYGKMAEASVGKDTMTGHWEIAGLHVTVPFRTFEHGFPDELIQRFEQRTGRKVIGNKPASGTEILDELGEAHMLSGDWIVYTSADSVFQLAAHEEVVPLQELYEACEIAREMTLQEPYAIGRVIARPFTGKPGAFTRTSNRHDYAVAPPTPTLLDAISGAGLDVLSVGKINDIFSGKGITESYPTKSNADGIAQILQLLERSFKGILFANLVDFDSLYGHRRDPQGYARALEQFDQALPSLLQRIGRSDLLVITADHGNDPTHIGTDHTREYVPLLMYSPALATPIDLGVRSTFADLSATIADNFGVKATEHGSSFLGQLLANLITEPSTEEETS